MGGTQLGSAVLGSSLNPDEALSVFQDLKVATRALSLETELHLVLSGKIHRLSAIPNSFSENLNFDYLPV